jgi:hypothetical protein
VIAGQQISTSRNGILAAYLSIMSILSVAH